MGTPRASTSKRKIKDESDSDVEVIEPSRPTPRKSIKGERTSDGEEEKKPSTNSEPAKKKVKTVSLTEAPAPNKGALQGLTFIFTGDLSLLDREAAQALVKSSGGKYEKAPGKETTHAVVGNNAAESKAKRLVQMNIRTLSEDEFYDLIRKGPTSSLYEPLTWKPGAQLVRQNQPAGTVEIPQGEPNCLVGLTFVFTGELASLAREDAVNLAKKYGGRVTGSPSSKTSFVVVGAMAGPAKLKKIQEMGITTISQDEFLDLIRTRKADEADEKVMKKKADEEKKVRAAAKEMKAKEIPEMKNALWTSKYAPMDIKSICGNKGNVEKLKNWLEAWPKMLKANFKKLGPDMTGTSRAILISGPPGIGKTTAAHLAAHLTGYSVLEMNASDTRSKRLLELGLKSAVDNTSLDGFFGTGSKSSKLFDGQPEAGKPSVLIMDEVDGMSGGDRGGVGALNVLIRKTKIPIICIANDRSLPKMKPLANTTFSMAFKRPSAAELRSRLMTIAFREKLKITGPVLDQLVEGAQSDMRQIINMMSTYALTAQDEMDFETGRKLAQSSEKNSLMTPFTLIEKLFGPYTFSQTSKMSLNDKLDYYFHDFGSMPLFVQENYAKFSFSRSNSLYGPEKEMKRLELVEAASSSISDGDLLDSVIHGSEQHWSLLPAHGFASTVRPAFFCYGMGAYGQGQGGYTSSSSSRAFPAWFGKNSSATRLRNALGNVQIHMRLRVSGDRREVRESYLPLLAQKLAQPLVDVGAEGIDQVISLMDDYYLTKDEYDTIMELGIGDTNGEVLLKGIDSKVKGTLTRNYNKGSHPIAFHKGSDLGKPPKKMAKGEKPDIEDLIELDEEVPDDEEENASDDESAEGAVSKDRLVKSKTKKPKKDADSKDSKPAKSKGKKTK